ncbi:hypothetical protein EI555_002924, partial [Monodon monoceros]
MSNTTIVPSTAGPGPSGGPGGGGGGGGGGTEVIQVTNVSPSASSEQMRTLFGFLGKIDELRLFPPDDSPLPVSSRVCFVKFHDPDSAVVAQHLTNTVFVDRALIVVPYAEGVIPDETKALSLLAPANAVAGLLPGGGLLPTPNPLTQKQGEKIQRLNHVAAGLVSPSLKSDTSSKEIEEAMKRRQKERRQRKETFQNTTKKLQHSQTFQKCKQVTRDYDEEEQGYDSEKEKKEEKKLTEPASPKAKECSVEKGTGDSLRES